VSSIALPRLAACLCVGAALVLAPSQAAQARAGGHAGSGGRAAAIDDQKIVELTTEGSRSASGLAFHETRARDVTATNAAVAYTSCDGCRAVSLSFQVVVADRGPTNLEVGNLALAMNENCSSCESVAVAYQVVLASDRDLVLGPAGRREITHLRDQLRRLARSDLPVAEVQSGAEAMMAQVADVLAAELHVRARIRHAHDWEKRPPRRADQPAAGHREASQGASHPMTNQKDRLPVGTNPGATGARP
jgi:hypothetical protein